MLKFIKHLPTHTWICFLLCSCASPRHQPQSDSTNQQQAVSTNSAELQPNSRQVTAAAPSALQAGYALLAQLSSQLRRVDQIFILKSASPTVESAVNPVATLFSEIDRELKSWMRTDASLAWSGAVLPTIEAETRKALEKLRTSELLSSDGSSFEKRLLASQDEGLAYAVSLLEQLVKAERQAARKTKLNDWLVRTNQLRMRISELLFSA